MNKSVLASIKPKYCELIAGGKKTVEIRKNRPKIDVPFKCYIYCTSTKNISRSEYLQIYRKTHGRIDNWRGKVIGEFVCDKISAFEYSGGGFLVCNDIATTINTQCKSCLTNYEFRRYAGEKSVYGWHISDLVIYDKPKELSELYNCNGCGYIGNCNKQKYPPQSWCYVEEVI